MNEMGVPVLLYYVFGKVRPINRSPSSAVLAACSRKMGPLSHVPASARDINVLPPIKCVNKLNRLLHPGYPNGDESWFQQHRGRHLCIFTESQINTWTQYYLRSLLRELSHLASCSPVSKTAD